MFYLYLNYLDYFFLKAFLSLNSDKILLLDWSIEAFSASILFFISSLISLINSESSAPISFPI